MRILHYIPRLRANDLISDHVRTLAEAMKDMAEVSVATAKDPIEKMLDELHPDIVHVHACWNFKAATWVRHAARKLYPVVISPHWQLEPYTMRHEHRIAKLLNSWFYQRRMVEKAEALLVTTEREGKNLEALGWQKRVHVVKSSLLNNTMSMERQARDTLTFYHKVIDTNYYHQMSDAEKEAVCSLLCIGTSQESIRNLLSSEQISLLHTITPEQWRRMLLYADDESIHHLLLNGAEKLNLNLSDIDTEAIDRYLPDKPKAKGTLDTSGVRDKAVRVTSKEEKVLCDIGSLLLAAHEQYKKQTLSMRHIAELYQAFKYSDYDEDQLVRITRQLGIRKFTERILQIIQEDLYISEGFLPMPTRNDRGTQRIRNTIIH